MRTQNPASQAIANGARSAATQRVVDRYAADPAAKNARSIALAQARGLTATDAVRLTLIARDCSLETTPITHAVYAVASQSQRGVTHDVEYDAAEDSATCACAAGVNGLPCCHAGAALLRGRALVKGDALLQAARAQREREAAAWAEALDAMQAREEARRAAVHAREEAALLYRSPRPFSMWRSEDAD